MVEKPHFLLLFLIGPAALAISLSTLNDFSRNRTGSAPDASMSQSELAEQSEMPETAAGPGPPEETSNAGHTWIGGLPAVYAPPDPKPSTAAAPMIELLKGYSRSFAVSNSSFTAQSPDGDINPAPHLNLTKPIENRSPWTALTTGTAGGPTGIPGWLENGLPQRKVPLFARDQPGDRLALPLPPVIDPITNPNTGSPGVPVLPDRGDDAKDEGSGANDPANTAPFANPGHDRTVFVGDVVTLDGSASIDPDGDPLTFRWTFGEKPAESGASLSDATAATATFTADVAGVYIVQLVVDDGTEESLPQLVVVTAELRGLTMPKVVGLSLAQAAEVLTGAGLKLARISTVPNPGIPKNQVVEQQPAAKSPVPEGAGVILVISFPPYDDDDQDGLPDAWEYAKFGHLNQAGHDDPDGDGYTNYQEYLVGTDPASAAEAPVPAGNFFEYDAFGRVIVKQITLEP